MNYDLELEEKKMKVKVGEEVYEISHPTVGMYEKMIEELKEGKTEMTTFANLVRDVGLPMEVVKKLSLPNLRKMVSGFIEAK